MKLCFIMWVRNLSSVPHFVYIPFRLLPFCLLLFRVLQLRLLILYFYKIKSVISYFSPLKMLIRVFGVYISQVIRFPRVCSHVDGFNNRNKCLITKILKQGYRYHKLSKAFSKFYWWNNDLVTKLNDGLKSPLQQGLSEPEFYGDKVYKFKKIRDMTIFLVSFEK